METSAKDNNNVQKAFETLFSEIVKIYKNKNNIDLNDNKEGNEGTKKNMKENGNTITGLAGGYTIQMEVKEDENILDNGDLGKKKCC